MEREEARGEWPGGVTPYGYTTDGKRGGLAPVRSEAAILRLGRAGSN